MEAVAEHINEMQKIYEEYGLVFDDLTKQHKDSHLHGIKVNHSTQGCPANTNNLYNICTMLDQRRRRWADVVQLLYKCFVLAVFSLHCYNHGEYFLCDKSSHRAHDIIATLNQRIKRRNNVVCPVGTFCFDV